MILRPSGQRESLERLRGLALILQATRSQKQFQSGGQCLLRPNPPQLESCQSQLSNLPPACRAEAGLLLRLGMRRRVGPTLPM